jgi:hypothetical protein
MCEAQGGTQHFENHSKGAHRGYANKKKTIQTKFIWEEFLIRGYTMERKLSFGGTQRKKIDLGGTREPKC